jgi:hypothetical protein
LREAWNKNEKQRETKRGKRPEQNDEKPGRRISTASYGTLLQGAGTGAELALAFPLINPEMP